MDEPWAIECRFPSRDRHSIHFFPLPRPGKRNGCSFRCEVTPLSTVGLRPVLALRTSEITSSRKTGYLNISSGGLQIPWGPYSPHWMPLKSMNDSKGCNRMGKFFLNLHSFLDLSHTDGKEYPIHLHPTTHTSTHFAGNKDSIPFGKGRDWKAGKLERFLNRDS